MFSTPVTSQLAAAACAVAALAAAAACGGSKNPVTPTPVTCTYALSMTSAQIPAGGQSITVHVDTGATCAWAVTASPSGWMTFSAPSGTGPADVVVTVAPNTATAERTGTVTIAQKDIAVRQSGRTAAQCVYVLESGSSTFGADGGEGRLNVQTAAGCAWTARSLATWITILAGTGNGPGVIDYEVARYDGTQQRDTRIVIDDASFTIRQDPPSAAPCTYGVDPTSTLLHWHGAVGDGFAVNLSTSTSCSWTAASGAPWIELLTTGSGSGPATMKVRVGAYTQETTRSAPLMIRWPTATAGQNVWVTQEGCYYAISVKTDTAAASGGRRRLSVFGTPVTTSCMLGCPWEARSNAPWLHVVGATSRAGDDDLSYDVDVNTTGAPRTGTLTIAGLTLTVTQGS
jgi:hypothetical protein